MPPVVEPTKLVAGERYELEELVGRGGYGSVYRAFDRTSGMPVAVKVLTAGTATDPHAVERMVREQQALVALAGTGAVAVLDLCYLPSGALCLVMEWLDGVDLERHLTDLEGRRQRLPVASVLAMLEPVASTLGRAHEAGIVHRDVKPANIFLAAPHGHIRLLDFGLSRMRSQAPLTAVGMVMGSPSYIAPEAWSGDSQRIDHRADLYSLSVVAFRMLAGHLPFEGSSLLDQHQQVTTGKRPSLHAQCPELPRGVDDWVEQAFAIHPEHRFNSAGAWYNALVQAVSEEPTPAPRSVTDSPEASPAELRSAISRALDSAAALLDRLAQQWQSTFGAASDSPATSTAPATTPAQTATSSRTTTPFASLPGMEGTVTTPAWPTDAERGPREDPQRSFVSDWLRGSELDQQALARTADANIAEWFRGSGQTTAPHRTQTVPNIRELGERLAASIAAPAAEIASSQPAAAATPTHPADPPATDRTPNAKPPDASQAPPIVTQSAVEQPTSKAPPPPPESTTEPLAAGDAATTSDMAGAAPTPKAAEPSDATLEAAEPSDATPEAAEASEAVKGPSPQATRAKRGAQRPSKPKPKQSKKASSKTAQATSKKKPATSRKKPASGKKAPKRPTQRAKQTQATRKKKSSDT